MTNTRQTKSRKGRKIQGKVLDGSIPSVKQPTDIQMYQFRTSGGITHPVDKRLINPVFDAHSRELKIHITDIDDFSREWLGRTGAKGVHYVAADYGTLETAALTAPDFAELTAPQDYTGHRDDVLGGAVRHSSSAVEEERLRLLQDAADHSKPQSNVIAEAYAAERDQAIVILGGPDALGRHITNDAELVEAIAIGFPADVIASLRASDVPAAALEQVIAPRRTLMRRKSEKQRLTRNESDSAWRLAWTVGLAFKVFKNRKSAVAWMSRPKETLNGYTAFDLVESSVGTAYVGRILHQLEWGDVA